MKPVVNGGLAWCCSILSAFAIVILSVLAMLFKKRSEALTGSTSSPDDPDAVAATIWGAVFVYIGFLAFCGCQVVHNTRHDRIQLS